jgi:hypothetical protein
MAGRVIYAVCWDLPSHTMQRQPMALPDPIPTLTVNSVTYDFARTSFGENRSVFSTANGLDVLTVSKQSRGARNRHMVRFDRTKVAASPFDAAKDQEYSCSAYTVLEFPLLGFTSAELAYEEELLRTFMAAGTPGYVVRVLQGEI